MVVVSDPTTEAARQVTAAAKRGDIDTATDTIIEAEASMALTLPGRAFAEVCWYGALYDKANQVLTYCDEAVRRLPNDADARDKRGLAKALTGNSSAPSWIFAFSFRGWSHKYHRKTPAKQPSECVFVRYGSNNWRLADSLQRQRHRRPVEGGRRSPWVSSESGQLYYASGSARQRTVVYEAPLPSAQPQQPATGTAVSTPRPDGGASAGNQRPPRPLLWRWPR
ncbi:MAG: hypothetical protein H6647_11195 [Anaerolineales bacterium]|nr:hypothetical protein [Anaerolineales bacterium]